MQERASQIILAAAVIDDDRQLRHGGSARFLLERGQLVSDPLTPSRVLQLAQLESVAAGRSERPAAGSRKRAVHPNAAYGNEGGEIANIVRGERLDGVAGDDRGARLREQRRDLVGQLREDVAVGLIPEGMNGIEMIGKIREFNKTTNQLKELRSEYISTTSELMFASKQSEVAKSAEKLGLREPIVPPTKIEVDSAELYKGANKEIGK